MATQRIQGFCALCRSRCGCISVVEDGKLVAVEPDPGHPTGQSLCVKGRAAPELVYAADRLLHPLRRTRPKGDADPGWVRITWDEALDWTAGRMREAVRPGRAGGGGLRGDDALGHGGLGRVPVDRAADPALREPQHDLG